MKIQSHKELRVWQEAMDLAMEIFVLSKSFPADERFSLTDQIRRSSRSVASNIAEAWRKRRYAAAFVAKLNDAEGEAAETQTHLEIALRCGYVAVSVITALDERYERLLAQLVTMSTQPEVWIISPKEQKKTMGLGDKETVRHDPSPCLTVPMSQSPPSSPSPSPKVPKSP